MATTVPSTLRLIFPPFLLLFTMHERRFLMKIWQRARRGTHVSNWMCIFPKWRTFCLCSFCAVLAWHGKELSIQFDNIIQRSSRHNELVVHLLCSIGSSLVTQLNESSSTMSVRRIIVDYKDISVFDVKRDNCVIFNFLPTENKISFEMLLINQRIPVCGWWNFRKRFFRL